MAIDGNNLEAIHNLAYLYEHQKKFVESIKYYMEAIRYKNVMAMHNLAPKLIIKMIWSNVQLFLAINLRNSSSN